MEDILLDAPRLDLAQDNLVGIATVQHVDDLKSWWHLARFAELADDGAIELGLVDFAGVVP